MISFPYEVGVLGWASTIVFWVAVVVIVVGIARLFKK
jgi:hypothetical protein